MSSRTRGPRLAAATLLIALLWAAAPGGATTYNISFTDYVNVGTVYQVAQALRDSPQRVSAGTTTGASVTDTVSQQFIVQVKSGMGIFDLVQLAPLA